MVVGAWFFLRPNENLQPIKLIHLLTRKHKNIWIRNIIRGWNNGIVEGWNIGLQ